MAPAPGRCGTDGLLLVLQYPEVVREGILSLAWSLDVGTHRAHVSQLGIKWNPQQTTSSSAK